MADLRINQLPLATGPTAPMASDNVAIDGLTTRKAPLSSLGDVIRPFASQAEAEAGAIANKVMSPLTTKQSVASEVGVSVQAYSAALDVFSGVPAGVRDYLDVAPYVDTRTSLKALDPSKDKAAILLESGRKGVFTWEVGDFSARVTLDTQEGIYVKANSVASSEGAWVRSGEVTVSSFGATATTDSSVAISAMASVLGYVRFPYGGTLLNSNITIAVPLHFSDGAFVDVATTRTLTISASITSPRQYVFRGAGNVKLDIAFSTGEDSRTIHASWFGIIPQNQDPTDKSLLFNKMFSAMSQSREGVIDFDNGSYQITWDALDPIPRGAWLRGCGIRRTTFDMVGTSTSASKLFRTGGAAGKITGIQFEHPEGEAASVHLGTAISLDHDDWYVEDVRCWDTQFGIVMNGARCEAHNIQSIYGIAMPSDSALVRVGFGGSVVDTVRVNDTTFGPNSIVQIGGPGATLDARNVRVSNVRTNKNSIGVQVYMPSGVSATGVQIDNIMNTGNEASPVLSLVHLITQGTGSINLLTASNLITNGTSASLFRVDQNSSGFTRDIVISTGVAIGAGNGVILNQTAGSLTDITISDSVDLDDRTIRVQRIGTMSNIKIGDLVGDVAIIADDEAVSFTIPGINQSCVMSIMTVNGADATAPRGLFLVRTGAAPVSLAMASTANITFTTGPLANGSGTDGNVTISTHTDGRLYISNRAGASRTIGVQPLAIT